MNLPIVAEIYNSCRQVVVLLEILSVYKSIVPFFAGCNEIDFIEKMVKVLRCGSFAVGKTECALLNNAIQLIVQFGCRINVPLSSFALFGRGFHIQE